MLQEPERDDFGAKLGQDWGHFETPGGAISHSLAPEQSDISDTVHVLSMQTEFEVESRIVDAPIAVKCSPVV